MAVKKAKEDDPEAVVLNFLKRQNRPYNANDLYNGLHGAVAKTQTAKILTSLVQNEKIMSKMYNKIQIFSAIQDEKECPTPDMLDAMDTEIENKKAKVNQLKEEIQSLQAKHSKLLELPKNESLEAKVKELTESNIELSGRLEKLRSSNINLDPTARLKIEKNMQKYEKERKLRKRLFKDILNTITEHYPGKPKELLEELGIDEEE